MIEMSLHQSEPVALPGRPFGRAARSVITHALVTAMMLAVQMLVFVPAVLFHCALRNGRVAAWLVAAAATGLFAVVVAMTPSAADEDAAWATVIMTALAVVLPAVLAVPLVERATRYATVVVFLIAICFAGLVATEVISRTALDFSPYASQDGAMETFKAQVLKAYPQADARAMERAASWTLFILPALLLVTSSFSFLMSLLMLGRLKVWREQTARLGTEQALHAYLFRTFSLPDWMLFAFIAGGIAPLASGVVQQILANVLTVTLFLYMLQGLAVFRYILGALTKGAFLPTLIGWMVFGLLAVITLFFPVALLLSVLGLFDPFFDFRHIKNRKDDSHESHSD